MELFADVGGLIEFFLRLGTLLVGPATAFAARTKLLSSAFRLVSSYPQLHSEPQDESEVLANQMSWESKHQEKIARNRLSWWHMCCSRDVKYKRMLRRAEYLFRRELDLVRFVRRQRMLTFATLAQMSRSQQRVTENMSQLVFHESSEPGQTDSDSAPYDDVDLSTKMDPKKEGYEQEELDENIETIFKSREPKNVRLQHLFQFQRRKKNQNMSMNDLESIKLQFI